MLVAAHTSEVALRAATKVPIMTRAAIPCKRAPAPHSGSSSTVSGRRRDPVPIGFLPYIVVFVVTSSNNARWPRPRPCGRCPLLWTVLEFDTFFSFTMYPAHIRVGRGNMGTSYMLCLFYWCHVCVNLKMHVLSAFHTSDCFLRHVFIYQEKKRKHNYNLYI